MSSEKHHALVLIGFMGSGKSHVARELSRRLGMPIYDLDAAIESYAGCSIPELFATRGEDVFRRIESEVLADALQHDSIVATGGGVVTRPENRAILQEAKCDALVVYLRARARTLARRIRMQPGSRPLIDGGGVLTMRQTIARVEEILQQRAEHYEACANLVVDTDALSATGVAAAIEAKFRCTF
ncbi:MAG TPA: shikimate kinase [Abditibacteriaceae bacterium]